MRSVRTEIVAELFTAGDSAEMIAEMYDLKVAHVNEAVRFELSLRVAA